MPPNPTVQYSPQLDITLNLNLRVRVDVLERGDCRAVLGEFLGPPHGWHGRLPAVTGGVPDLRVPR